MAVQMPPLLKDSTGQEIKQAIQGLTPVIPDFISDAFSVERSYSKGDITIYNNNVYEFTANKSAGAWDSTKVTQTTIGAVCTSLNNSLTQKASISFSAQNVANGKSGITISNQDWHEVSVIVGFGTNPEYQVEFFIPRQFVNTVGTKKFLQGSSDGTDTHVVVLEVSTTGVKLISWKFRGTEVTANCPMYIYWR